MSSVSSPESRNYLAHLLSEMLSVEGLPSDLQSAISQHLNNQLSLVNILKPEYCKRLYPILVELAEMSNPSEPEEQSAMENGADPNGHFEQSSHSEHTESY